MVILPLMTTPIIILLTITTFSPLPLPLSFQPQYPLYPFQHLLLHSNPHTHPKSPIHQQPVIPLLDNCELILREGGWVEMGGIGVIRGRMRKDVVLEESGEGEEFVDVGGELEGEEGR